MQFDLKFSAPTFAGLNVRAATRENLDEFAAVIIRGNPYKDDRIIVTPRQIASSDLGAVCLLPVEKNPEYVVRAQPQLILASDAALREMPKRPGWPALSALRDRRTCAFPPGAYDTIVRPGPRLAEAADLLVECLRTLDEARR